MNKIVKIKNVLIQRIKEKVYVIYFNGFRSSNFNLFVVVLVQKTMT